MIIRKKKRERYIYICKIRQTEACENVPSLSLKVHYLKMAANEGDQEKARSILDS